MNCDLVQSIIGAHMILPPRVHLVSIIDVGDARATVRFTLPRQAVSPLVLDWERR